MYKPYQSSIYLLSLSLSLSLSHMELLLLLYALPIFYFLFMIWKRFVLKNVVNSGIGEQTYAPRTIIAGREQNPTILDAISEMEEFFHDSIAKLLARTAISPLEIEVLVVNVSMLSLVPSLAARIINHYKMRDDIKV
ncbi:3-ketoacyl-coa synthase 12 [Quercus suber]|uniref:3-ketoacyl-coa synthase 12 n=1 Tax=Quercus suber TaxID=58331 RepID=A0AAW0JDW4_QUESU